MPGTILENLSNRKLIIVLSIIFLIQTVSFLIGAFIAPAPSSPEQYIATKCIAEKPDQFSIPREMGPEKNCRLPELHEQNNITFAFQMPLPRGGLQLDYSRWMQNLLTLFTPEVLYDTRLSGNAPGDQHINATVILNVRLGVKNIGDSNWKQYYHRTNLKRTITCHIEEHKRKQGMNYDCDSIQLFELQSLYYDYYLINLQFVADERSDRFGFLNNLSLVAIHQNGGFTKTWLALKSVFFVITLLTLLWNINRINQLKRDSNLLEKALIMFGIGITQLNAPIEYLNLFIDVEFMSFLCDIRQGIFHCSLLIFWIIFIGEHLPHEDASRVGLSSYSKQLAIILIAYISLFIFESSQRGIQVIDPFYSIWEVDFNFAIIFIMITVLAAISYFFFLAYHLSLAYRNISTKQKNLPSMPTARRLIYQGVIFRFKFLLIHTIICAACTIIAYIMGRVSEDQWYWDDQRSFLSSLQWSSAMFTTVFALWNCYVMTLLILYAPSHKGMNSELDEMSVEFTRLTDNDLNDGQARINYTAGGSRSKKPTCEMSLLQELATKRNIS